MPKMSQGDFYILQPDKDCPADIRKETEEPENKQQWAEQTQEIEEKRNLRHFPRDFLNGNRESLEGAVRNQRLHRIIK